MDQSNPHPNPSGRDRQYEETVDPNNPPNSVLQPEVRGATVNTFLGGIVVFFLIVAAALVYFRTSGERINPDPGLRDTPPPGARNQVGTSGERTADSHNPEPTPGSTRDEIAFRGGEAAEASTLSEILDKPLASIGSRVSLNNLNVASTDADGFWIHDGNSRLQVVQPAGPTPVRPGQAVNVIGVVEPDGRQGIRIRAERVTVK